MDKEIIHVWQGERKLFPARNDEYDYLFRCISGWGYLRIMSESNRLLFQTDNALRVPSQEIITISAVNDMVIELEVINNEEDNER